MEYRLTMRKTSTGICSILAAALTIVVHGNANAGTPSPGPRIEISFPAAIRAQPLTGRVFLMISRKREPEVRLQSYGVNSPEFLGADVTQWQPGKVLAVGDDALGYPFRRISELPPGEYYLQAAAVVYREYPRTDGHTIWALDQWNGQQFNNSPGTLYSAVAKIDLRVASPAAIHLELNQIVPPAPEPVDTDWVKHVKIQSKLLSDFWGRPIYIGAVVLLPRGYHSDHDLRYPVIYQQQAHFSGLPPFDFMTEDRPEGRERHRRECRGACETGYEFYRTWISGSFPKVIAVALQHPTPFADFSSAMNSANNGPYGDAIVKELIPYLDEHFRTIPAAHARLIVGKSMGGRDALALQLHYPESFGGAWIFYPWAISCANYGTLDIYQRDNAFEIKTSDSPAWYGFWSEPEWSPLDRASGRTVDGQTLTTFRQESWHDAVVQPRTGGESGGDDAVFGPVAQDGLPRPLWDRFSGAINSEVAQYWKQNGDLFQYAQTNWATLAPKLHGKLHFYVGEMDEYYRQRGVHQFESFLRTARPSASATFEYAPLGGHGWQPMSNGELLRAIAGDVADNTAAVGR